MNASTIHATIQAYCHDHAALHLCFSVASCVMFRKSFLRWHAYTIHLGVINQLIVPRFSPLWEQEFGSGDNDSSCAPLILEAIDAIREVYRPFASKAGASDILVTKVLFGTLGCLPACDTYFKAGFKRCGFKYSSPDASFCDQVFRFCKDHLFELREEQAWIEKTFKVQYPLMKIVDMYFWQIGWTAMSDPASGKGAHI